MEEYEGRRDEGSMRGTCERGVGCGCVREGEWGEGLNTLNMVIVKVLV